MNHIEEKIATSIETGVFYSIIKFLKKNGWKLAAEYDDNIFDEGIDFDLYKFCKEEDTLLLAWSNWFEGEIRGTMKVLTQISEHFEISLTFGEPEYLRKPDILEEMKYLIKFKR